MNQANTMAKLYMMHWMKRKVQILRLLIFQLFLRLQIIL